MLLSLEQIEEFKDTGVLIVENVFTDDEIHDFRTEFHKCLKKIDIDHDLVLQGICPINEGPRIKNKISRIFYAKWKLQIQTDPKVYQIMKELLLNTYGSGITPNFEHPFGEFTDIHTYIDRVCYRLPDVIKAEGGLGLHLDRNPTDPYLFKSTGLKKWRPIQTFVALTDHYSGDSGGLRVVSGFHKQINDYFKNPSLLKGGEFYRMHSKKHTALEKKCQPLIIPKGSLVCWDNRLPHATCQKLSGFDTREVVYTGFLPNTELNKIYIENQLKAIRSNHAPPAYEESNSEICDKDWDENELTDHQKKLLGIL
jgi:ectoine hydroxylase-related dioxygenase (phytanoyl-CoA dioxygenase family)